MKWQLIPAFILMAVFIASCAPQEAPQQPVPQPAPQPVAVPEPAPVDDVVTKKKVMSGDYLETKEDGVIRGVGCDVESNTVMFMLHNPSDTDWNFYEKVIPTPPNSMKTSLNGLTLVGLDCDADLLAAGDTVKCSKTGSEAADLIRFREPQTEFMDDLSVTIPGYGDELKFRCVERGDWTPEVEEDFSTRIE